jgi:hypothetical protein
MLGNDLEWRCGKFYCRLSQRSGFKPGHRQNISDCVWIRFKIKFVGRKFNSPCLSETGTRSRK